MSKIWINRTELETMTETFRTVVEQRRPEIEAAQDELRTAEYKYEKLWRKGFSVRAQLNYKTAPCLTALAEIKRLIEMANLADDHRVMIDANEAATLAYARNDPSEDINEWIARTKQTVIHIREFSKLPPPPVPFTTPLSETPTRPRDRQPETTPDYQTYGLIAVAIVIAVAAIAKAIGAL